MDKPLSERPEPVQALQLRGKELEANSPPVCMVPAEVSGSCYTKSYNPFSSTPTLLHNSHRGRRGVEAGPRAGHTLNRERKARGGCGPEAESLLACLWGPRCCQQGFHIYPVPHQCRRETRYDACTKPQRGVPGTDVVRASGL